MIATLLADGTPDALTAAEQITKGVERDLGAVGLTRAERTAALAWPVCWRREFGGSGKRLSAAARPLNVRLSWL